MRRPALMPIALLLAAPFRIPVNLGSQHAFLLLPFYGVLAAAALAFCWRLVRAEPRLGRLPAGFGAEVHLNVGFAVAGRPITVADVGVYHGPVRPSGDIASGAAEAILDLAEEHGRLHPHDRDRWNAWAAGVTAVIRDRPERGPLEDFQARLSDAVSHRPDRA